MTRSRALHIAREVFLTAGAVLGVVCIVVTLSGLAFGIKPLMFRSGSMAPAIHTGDLAFSRTVDAAQVSKGDIISVVNSSGNRVTHRMVSAAKSGDARQFTLKGDANKSPDVEVYTAKKVQRVMVTIPKAGYVVAAASSQIGIFILGIYVALMLLLVIRRPTPPSDPDGDADRPRKPGARRAKRSARGVRARSAAVLAMSAAIAAGSITASSPSMAAFWTDPATIGGGTYTTYTVPTPTLNCGALGVLSVTFSWPAVANATSYTLFYNGGASSKTVSTLTTNITGAINLSSSAWLVANRNFGSTTWSSANSNTRNYTFLVVSLCS